MTLLESILIGVSAILFVLLAFCVKHLAHYRLRLRNDPLLFKWPIAQVSPEDITERMAEGPFGAKLEAEVSIIPAYQAYASLNDLETVLLANLAKDSERAFELGTASGRTTYIIASNMRATGHVTTITLSREQALSYVGESGDAKADSGHAVEESQFETFLYSGTPMENRITQLFGDSKTFDEGPYQGAFDLIFVDGSHAYSYVMHDSLMCQRMLAPGGIMVWHDYKGRREVPGTYRCLNELNASGWDLKHVLGTSFVTWRKN
ncbi:MAG: putative O-methyltransferase YrrM [Candidatus Pseudothioglobus sp.]